MQPLNIFFLSFFPIVRSPFLIAKYGIAFTKSRNVIPGCIFPLNLTKTDSGISNGITPIAAANATKPDPAGKEIPNGNLVCESPPVPTLSGKIILLSHE